MDEFELAEAVNAGAEFMDAIDANVTDDAERWFWVVDPEKLNMGVSNAARGTGCVTAQHHPTRLVNFLAYGLHVDDPLDALAFNIAWEAGRHTDELTALWREAIYDRRSEWFDRHPEPVIA